MAKTARILRLLLYLLERPRTLDELRLRFPYVNERTMYRDLADIRRAVGLELGSDARYHVTRTRSRPAL